MDAARQVTATFTLNSYPLTVTKAGSGAVVSTPGGINCGNDCTMAYVHGAGITLTAVAATGYTFGGWSGACSASGVCSVVMDGPRR